MNDYLEVSVKRELEQLCTDCYKTLGWTILGKKNGIEYVSLKLQRDRKIKNRNVLCELQRKCEDAFIAIEKMEKVKTTKAMAVSLGVGIIGTAFMTGAVFAYLGALIPVCVILAIPGFIGWSLAYPLYKKFLKESLAKLNPLIQNKYEEIYEACEKVEKL